MQLQRELGMKTYRFFLLLFFLVTSLLLFSTWFMTSVILKVCLVRYEYVQSFWSVLLSSKPQCLSEEQISVVLSEKVCISNTIWGVRKWFLLSPLLKLGASCSGTEKLCPFTP